MGRNIFSTAIALFVGAWWSLAAIAADTPATIPASFQGTYSLTFTASSSKPPFTNGAKVTLVIMSGNQLCVNGTTLSDPVIRNNNGHEAIWTDASSKIQYALSSLITGYNEVNVSEGVYGTGSFIFHGQLNGSKTSTATTCTGGVSGNTPTVSASVQSVFDLAAELYPTMFKNGGALGNYLGYVYKYFADSKIYVGIKDDKIYTLGGVYGDTIKEQGAVTAVLNMLQTTKTNLMNTPVPGISLYKLTLSGSLKTSLGISVPVSVTINDMPAPAVSDTSIIVDQVKTTLGASGIANIKVTSINNTASRVTFRVEFTAAVSGLGSVTYDLTYDYTK